jgi:ATP-dependent exoDNAse (exonuclease V) beta subunit
VAARAGHYAPQIRSYAMALHRITGKPVKERILYFLRIGEAISIE